MADDKKSKGTLEDRIKSEGVGEFEQHEGMKPEYIEEYVKNKQK